MIGTGLLAKRRELTEMRGTSRTANAPRPVGRATLWRIAIVCVSRAVAVTECLRSTVHSPGHLKFLLPCHKKKRQTRSVALPDYVYQLTHRPVQVFSQCLIVALLILAQGLSHASRYNGLGDDVHRRRHRTKVHCHSQKAVAGDIPSGDETTPTKFSLITAKALK
jgi:hypothetical protein